MTPTEWVNLFTILKMEEQVKVLEASYGNDNLIKQISDKAEKEVEEIISSQWSDILKINKEVPSAEIFIESLKTKNPIMLKVLEKTYDDLKEYFNEISKNSNIEYKTFEIFIREQLKPFYLNSDKKSNNKIVNMEWEVQNYSCIWELAFWHTWNDFVWYWIML